VFFNIFLMRPKVKLHLSGNFSTFFTSNTMTFLNPLVLFGLAAAAIPILLHLLNLRKLKTVEFSTLRFLHELQRTRMRKIRLRQWLLLIVRTLLIAFLVFAFSRPTLKGSIAGLGTSAARSTIILLVDDSPSMGIPNAEGVIFDQVRTMIQQIAGLARPGDELHILRLSGSSGSDTSGSLWSPERAPLVVRSLSLSNRSYGYANLLRQALDIAGRAQTANREIYLMTDLQASHFAQDPEAADTTQMTVPNVRVFLVGFNQLSHENAAVASCMMESRILAQNRPLSIRTTVRNYGEQPMRNSVVSLYLDGVRVAQQTVDISPEGSAALTLSATPRRRGVIGGAVRIEDDVLEIDNSRYFSAAIPDTVNVLIAGATPENARFASLALTLSGDSSIAGLFHVDRVTDNQLAYTDLQKYDVLVLSAPHALSPELASRIVSAIRQGKGLLVFPGSGLNAVELNTDLIGPLGIPPIALPGPLADDRENAGFIRFRAIDYAHPIFTGMFEREHTAGGTQPAIESPRIRSAATLATGTTGSTLISLTDGRPFLREYQAGTGRVLLCAVDAGTEWSDFAVRGIFAPLLHRSILYLAMPQVAKDEAHVGDPLTFQLLRSSGEISREYVLVSPSGTEERVTPRPRPGTGTLLFTSAPAEEPGLYRLRYGGSATDGDRSALQALAVHPNALESDLRPAPDNLLAAFWKRFGMEGQAVKKLDAGDSLVRQVEETRHGVELWRLFLTLAVGCALLEMLLARVIPTTVPEESSHG